MANATFVGTEIVEGVAAREGIDPLDLDEKLYDVIDADALDALTRGASDRRPQEMLIEFTYYGYSVTVDGAGEVTIDELPAAETNEPLTDQ